MKNLLLAFVLVFAASFATAQDLEFEVSAGLGYADVESNAAENVFGSFELGGVAWKAFSGGSLVEITVANGDFAQRVYARGAVELFGERFFAAVDTAVNGDGLDPRAVFGLNYEKFTIEGYGAVDGDRLFGAAVRYQLPF